MWQAGESRPLLSTSTAERAFVSWSFSSSGLEPRSKGKGGKNGPTFQLQAEWPGTGEAKRYEPQFINNCVISPVGVDTTVKHVLLSRTRKCFLSCKKTLPYSLLLLLSVVVVVRGGGKGIANSLSNAQRGNHEECFLSEVWIVGNYYFRKFNK